MVIFYVAIVRSPWANLYFRPPNIYLLQNIHIKSGMRTTVQVPVRCFCVVIWFLLTAHSVSKLTEHAKQAQAIYSQYWVSVGEAL